MSEQEREHWDHVAGSASEFQNCYEEARMAAARANYQASIEIAQALEYGLFVVVADGPYYCRVTDAVAGHIIAFVSAHITREEADAAAQVAYGDGNRDESYEVLPRLPDPAPAQSPVDNNDVPF